MRRNRTRGSLSTGSAGSPLMERPLVAASLAGVAGLLNAWTFQHAGTFATVQSGNIVSAGYFAAGGDWERVGAALSSIVGFAVGAAVCAIAVGLLSRRNRPYSLWILGSEAVVVMLLIPLSQTGPASWVAVAVSAVAGAQGSAFHRDRGMLYGNTAVTFVLQSTAGLLGRALISGRAEGEQHLRPAGVYALVLAAFAGGGAAGFLAGRLWSSGPLMTAGAILAALAVTTIVYPRGAVDPDQRPHADPSISDPTMHSG